MTRYEQIKKALDNPEKLGLKEHLDLIMELPTAKWAAEDKYSSKTQQEEDKIIEGEIEQILLEKSEPTFDDKLLKYGI